MVSWLKLARAAMGSTLCLTIAIADAADLVKNENLGTKMRGDPLEAHMKLPERGVADSGNVTTPGGLSWARMNASFLDYEGSVPNDANSGVHNSSFAGTWHYQTAGGVTGGGKSKPLSWQMDVTAEIGDAGFYVKIEPQVFKNRPNKKKIGIKEIFDIKVIAKDQHNDIFPLERIECLDGNDTLSIFSKNREYGFAEGQATDKAGRHKIIVTAHNGKSIIEEITVIEPQGIAQQIHSLPSYAQIGVEGTWVQKGDYYYHLPSPAQDAIGIIMFFKSYVLPNDVSFSGILIGEDETDLVFESGNLQYENKGNDENDNKHKRWINKVKAPTGIDGNGSLVLGPNKDTWTDGALSRHSNDPSLYGTESWDIPWFFSAYGDDKAKQKIFTTIRQSTTIEQIQKPKRMTKFTLSKGNFSRTHTYDR